MTTKLKKIASLISSVELSDVRLVESSVKTAIRSPKDTGDVDITFSTVAKVAAPPTAGVFYVLATGEMNIVTRQTKAPAVSIRAAYELKYHLPEKLKTNLKDLNEFAQVNGTFNAWPFFREFIQSSFERMHLPAMTLPVYRLGNPPFGSSKSSTVQPKARAGLKG